MGSSTFPVRLIYEDRPAYAKGGLVNAALAVKRAGRHGDTEVIHINKAEYNELVRQWGKPTINPETGMPEFFLGKIGKILKKVAKIALPIAAIAIPGIGPAIGGALGLSGAAAGAVGSGLLGAASGALGGGGLKGALMGGALGGLTGGLGAKGARAAAKATQQAAASGASGIGANVGNAAAQAAQLAAPTAAQAGQAAANFGIDAGTQAAINSAAAGNVAPSLAAAQGAAPAAAAAAKPNFWNRNFLGTGIKNKYALPVLGIGGTLLAGALGKKGGGDAAADQQQQAAATDFNQRFNTGALPSPNIQMTGGQQPAGNLRPLDQYFTQHTAGYRPYARGGDVESSLAVAGPGHGREDTVDALLSDGEYVMDAETVSMLGNGSNRAGAKALDQLRVNLRKHKGKAMTQGRFSASAKTPERYMRRAG